MKVKFNGHKIIASVVVAAMSIAFIPKIMGSDTVLAATTKNANNTCLCTTDIQKPDQPGSKDDKWSGSYVYFGTYGGNPIKFRVLAPSTNVYGSSTLFLNSDEVLFEDCFDKTPDINGDYTSSWADSSICDMLNGTFLTGFTSLEQGAIAKSKGTGGLTYDSFLTAYGTSSVSVSDQVFILDASEVMNPAYGYSTDSGWEDVDQDGDWSTGTLTQHEVANRVESSPNVYSYWLRSALVRDARCALVVQYDGILCNDDVTTTKGVAPALNVDRSKIIFSTAVDGTYGQVGASYKLTIYDDSLSITAGEASVTGTKVSIGNTVSGGPSQISVLILSDKYTDGNTNGATIKYYGALSEEQSFDFSATGLDLSGWGKDYYVYILAETVNDGYKTDYASAPVAIDAPAGEVTTNYNVTVNSGSADVPTAAAGATVTITAGTAPAGKEFDKWEVVSGTIALAEATSSTTTFTMPAEDVEVTATYRDIPITTHTVTFNANGHGTAPAAQTIDDGNAATEPTAPMASGWTFGGWYTEAACANKFDFSTAITGDITLYAKWTEETPSTVYYTVVGGGNSTFTKGSASDLVVTVKRSEADETCFSHFTGVQIDGVTLVSGTDYTAVAGSTVITIKAEALNNLSEGGHTINVLFDDGKTETSVTVKAAGTNSNSNTNGNKAIPATGETLAPTLFVGIAFVAVAGMLFAVILVQKKRKSVR